MIYDTVLRRITEMHRADGIWEAPNWSRDGRYLLSNSGGRLYRIPVDGSSAPQLINLDPALRANNDHDFSYDGKLLAISGAMTGATGSQVFVADPDGSNHRLVVSASPSYFHGWSPDGKYLSFVANRDMKQYDLYRVPVGGGPEERLTVDPAADDGTDYSPDGKWIYFNSNRGGGWNVWRMPADGAGPNDQLAQRVTNDEYEDWFPHPSLDGKWLVFLSFPPGTVGHNDRNLPVKLRMIPLPGDTIQPVQPTVLVDLIGGQGTINVNSWSPDSLKFAYVAYIDNQPPKPTP
jgi:TolB protein